MRPDRSWMARRRDRRTGYLSEEYMDGIDAFMKLVNENPINMDSAGRILCPCKRCKNRVRIDSFSLEKHLYSHGFMESYENWTLHGENKWDRECSAFIVAHKTHKNKAKELVSGHSKPLVDKLDSSYPKVNTEVLNVAGPSKKRRVQGLDHDLEKSTAASSASVTSPAISSYMSAPSQVDLKAAIKEAVTSVLNTDFIPMFDDILSRCNDLLASNLPLERERGSGKRRRTANLPLAPPSISKEPASQANQAEDDGDDDDLGLA